MSQHQTYRVLVTGHHHFIDIPARDADHAVQRAEHLWHRDRQRFEQVLHVADFDVDTPASEHLADIANDDRARWAQKALKVFACETGSEMGAEALHDLVCDLGHYADEHRLDFRDLLTRAAATWEEERADKQGAQP